MIGLQEYSKIKDNYCLCYFGLSGEYPVLLEILRPSIEAKFPGLSFYICCQDKFIDYMNDKSKCFAISELKERKRGMAHIKELFCDLTKPSHPIELFLEDCGITNFRFRDPEPPKTRKCVITTSGNFPTVSLTDHQIAELKRIAVCKGFEPVLNESCESCGLVMGVESVVLFKAMEAGIQTALVPTGVGTSLVKKINPSIEILNVR